MTNDKLNGSVETLAYAFRDVIVEAVSPLYKKIDGLGYRIDRIEQEMGSMNQRMGSMEKDMGSMKQRMDSMEQSIETTNKNMAAQFAAQSKYISEEIDKKLSRLGK
ncbi:MAG: hypothetical protein OXE97_00510 [Gammaproteobacteria bacterium]|nr:hypothetical protein [Gammaproteobacteria bacterium]MCY4283211.1 hypothetical protein [Gammaproteobacteria bacterium]